MSCELRQITPGYARKLLADPDQVLHYAERAESGRLPKEAQGEDLDLDKARHGLELPRLPRLPPTPALGWLARLFGSDQLPPQPALSTSTLGELTDWTVALNFELLLPPPYHNQYDVEQAVIGLTCHQCGISVEEIRLGSSFTNDLGMD